MIRLLPALLILLCLTPCEAEGRRVRWLNPGSAGAAAVWDARFLTGSDSSGISSVSSRIGSNTATQGTGAYQPLLRTGANGIGGSNVMAFDGTDDFLSYGTSLFTYTGQATVFSAFNYTAAASQYGSILCDFNGSGFPRTSIGCQPSRFPDNAGELATDCYSPGGMRYNSTYSGSIVATWSWSNWSTQSSNGNTILGVNSVEVAGTSYGNQPTGFTSVSRSIGRFDHLDSSESNFIQAKIGVIVVFTTQIALPLRNRIRQSMAFAFKIAQ
ncbi:MAG: hypothetical protein K8R87_01105 [Verrucomicrobia bacterium]|nr:hypothetical protein [Verrucomicrobiota bacterium]